jgi:hypothetical protein
MNVTLNYKNSEYNFDLAKTTPLSYLYKISEEKFKLLLNNINLYYEETYIPNSQIAASDFFKSNKKIQINVIVKNNSLDLSFIKEKNTNNSEGNIGKKSSFFISLPKLNFPNRKKLKKHYIKCQICLKKDAIFYCRHCNQFFCPECNIRFPIHYEHKIINLENGNLKGNVDVYRKLILDELNIVKTAFISSNEWIIDNQIRFEYLQNLVEIIREIDEKSFELSSMKTSYNVELELLNELRNELFEIEAPEFKDDVVKVFSEINEKEKSLINFTIFVNLQVIKSQFNKKMIMLFEIIQHYLQDILTDVNNKLNEARKINIYGLKELKEYNDSHSEASTKEDENININLNNNSENNSNRNNNINHKHHQSFPNINSKINNKTDEKLYAFTERMAPILKNKNNSINNISNNNSNFINNNSNFINNNPLNNSKIKTEIEPYIGKQSFLQHSDFKVNNKLNSFLNPHNFSMNDTNIMNRTLSKRTPHMLRTFLTTSNVNSNDGSVSYKKQIVSPPKFSDNNSELKLFLSAQKKKPKSKIGDLIDLGSIRNIFNNPVKKKKKGK